MINEKNGATRELRFVTDSIRMKHPDCDDKYLVDRVVTHAYNKQGGCYLNEEEQRELDVEELDFVLKLIKKWHPEYKGNDKCAVDRFVALANEAVRCLDTRLDLSKAFRILSNDEEDDV